MRHSTGEMLDLPQLGSTVVRTYDWFDLKCVVTRWRKLLFMAVSNCPSSGGIWQDPPEEEARGFTASVSSHPAVMSVQVLVRSTNIVSID